MYKEYQTQHYIFHYQEGSLAEHDIEQISRLQETCFSYICDVLQVTFPETIDYWLCDTTEKELWNEYCDKFHMDKNMHYEAWSFGDDPDALAKLVCEGRKTATLRWRHHEF